MTVKTKTLPLSPGAGKPVYSKNSFVDIQPINLYK